MITQLQTVTIEGKKEYIYNISGVASDITNLGNQPQIPLLNTLFNGVIDGVLYGIAIPFAEAPPNIAPFKHVCGYVDFGIVNVKPIGTPSTYQLISPLVLQTSDSRILKFASDAGPIQKDTNIWAVSGDCINFGVDIYHEYNSLLNLGFLSYSYYSGAEAGTTIPQNLSFQFQLMTYKRNSYWTRTNGALYATA